MCFGITSLLNVMHGILLVHMFVCKREPEVMAVLLPVFGAHGCSWSLPADLRLPPDTNSQTTLKSATAWSDHKRSVLSARPFWSLCSLRTKLTRLCLTGWDPSRCRCGRIHDFRCRRSFQPGHLSWLLSWPGVKSGTAGERKEMLNQVEATRRRKWNGMETVLSNPCDVERCCRPLRAE